jgi:hypothetical protein
VIAYSERILEIKKARAAAGKVIFQEELFKKLDR